VSLLAKRYAHALFGAASKVDAVDAVSADLASLQTVLADPTVRAIALDPDSRKQVRSAALRHLVVDAHSLTSNLVEVLLERRREQLLPELHQAFRLLALAMRGEAEGVLETAKEIGEAELARIEETVSRVHGKKVALTVKQNPDLIGGVRIYIGTTLYDGSVATALEELERRLMEAPLS